MKGFFRIILVMVLVIGMVLTNPTIDDYKAHVRYDLDNGNDGILEQIGGYLLSETASQLVERKNYVLFSVYVLPVPFSDRELISIGIFQFFIDIGH